MKLTKLLLELKENNTNNKDLEKFLSDKKLKNFRKLSYPGNTRFLYHGTRILPNKFELKYDYDFEDSNTWSGDLPEGHLFLTTSLKEARAYGQYIIPCELKSYSNKSFKIYSDNPSQVFDRDYGIDLYRNDEYYGFWEKFHETGKSVLIIKGTNRWTLITDIDNVIPRTDLAIEFYDLDKT